MEYQNAIKQYKSPIDKDGEYRVYAVLPLGIKFVFDCSFWTMKEGSSAVGTIKVHEEYENLQDAIDRYDEYINTWETDSK